MPDSAPPGRRNRSLSRFANIAHQAAYWLHSNHVGDGSAVKQRVLYSKQAGYATTSDGDVELIRQVEMPTALFATLSPIGLVARHDRYTRRTPCRIIARWKRVNS